MSENYFNVLNTVNVNEQIKKKNGLSYLSWAWAWAEVKKKFPDANYTVYEDDNGCIYWTDGRTCWVKTGVTVNGLEHIEYLPVMDFRNKSIPAKSVTSFDVNKAIQRSLTKAVARHGLGLYIYAGEDLPENERTEEVKAKTEVISAKEVETLKKMCERKGVTKSGYRGKKFEALTGDDYAEAMRELGKMADKEPA